MHHSLCRLSSQGTYERPAHSGPRALLTTISVQTPPLAADLLLDTYFARIHGKPYYILDESTTRQRLQTNQLPGHLAYAIYAVSARYDLPSMSLKYAVH